jgi:hypothetical protein
MTDGYVHLQHSITVARSKAASVKATGTAWTEKVDGRGPSITDKITPAGSLFNSQPGGPLCWASPLGFGLIGYISGRPGLQVKVKKMNETARSMDVSLVPHQAFYSVQIFHSSLQI